MGLSQLRKVLQSMVMKVVYLLLICFLLAQQAQSVPVFSTQNETSYFQELRQMALREYDKFQSDFRLDIKTITASVECSICKFAIGLLQRLLLVKATEDEIISIATEICQVGKMESKRVCKYIVEEFKDEFFYVVDNLVLSPEEACGILFGSSCGHSYDPRFFWNLTLPNVPKPPVVPPKPPKPGSPITKVLQLSDFHYDRYYQPGSNAECGEPMCCRANDGKPGPSVQGAGKYGDYRNCDAPKILLDSLFQHLRTSEKFDYILMTGDLPAHDVWNQSRTDQLTVLEDITDMFLKYYPGMKVYPAVGNHESAPVNSFPPEYVTGDLSISWLYDAFVYQWVNKTGWLPPDTIPTIKRGGYYTVQLQPGLRLVSLNMNMCNSGNYWLLLNATDPTGELEWLINVLQMAETNKEKVHIIGHNHPSSCMKAFGWNYYKIVDRYESTITAQFFGHAHIDYFEVFYDEETLTRPTSVAYISGSVTPFQSLNPSYRLYDIDGNYSESSTVVLEHYTNVLNLTEVNLTDKPRWFREYTAKTAFNMTSLLPSDWQKVIENFKKNDTMFQNFYRYFNKLHVTSPCDEQCKESLICQLQTARADDPSLCKDRKISFEEILNFRRMHIKC
ncbi:sphingomyelin phosphodiesterase-like [Ptychodera flava]|uniref:sphingomyelin phosphodiesterase-like n=1 Tax=Ptychodera flava TaxID=63121 RepID=UPI00396A6FF1